MRTVEKIETAVEPRFQEHFVDAMAFPHATASIAESRHRGRPAGRALDSCRTGAAAGADAATSPTSRPPNRRRTMSEPIGGGR